MTQPNADPFLTELRRIKKEYADETLMWYTTRASHPRVMFRVSGTTVILASLAIPFLVPHGDERWAAIGASIAALLSAGLTALNSFYGWQGTWQKYINTQLLLEGFVAEWDVEMAAATAHSDVQAGRALGLVATRALVRKVESAVIDEAGRFFERIEWPSQDTRRGEPTSAPHA
jgi:hypothetical protein